LSVLLVFCKIKKNDSVNHLWRPKGQATVEKINEAAWSWLAEIAKNQSHWRKLLNPYG
jgi:hypothetical protein